MTDTSSSSASVGLDNIALDHRGPPPFLDLDQPGLFRGVPSVHVRRVALIVIPQSGSERTELGESSRDTAEILQRSLESYGKSVPPLR